MGNPRDEALLEVEENRRVRRERQVRVDRRIAQVSRGLLAVRRQVEEVFEKEALSLQKQGQEAGRLQDETRVRIPEDETEMREFRGVSPQKEEIRRRGPEEAPLRRQAQEEEAPKQTGTSSRRERSRSRARAPRLIDPEAS